LLSGSDAPKLSQVATELRLPPARHAQREAMLPSKMPCRNSCSSVVSAAVRSRDSANVALQSAFDVHVELLHFEQRALASSQLKKAVQPICDYVDSMHGWLLRANSFLERQRFLWAGSLL
jgi:hypothetical protein